MSNNKQSSVEWLFQKLWDTPKDKLNWYAIAEQAKTMHKDEICKAYVFGAAYGIDISNGLKPDKYYNQTFNNEL